MDATVLNDTAVAVTWNPPSVTIGVGVYIAYSNGTNRKFCEVVGNGQTCTIGELTRYTPYNVCVEACRGDEITSTAEYRLCSNPKCKVVHTLTSGKYGLEIKWLSNRHLHCQIITDDEYYIFKL